MADQPNVDWSGYIGGLREGDLCALAIWLADEGLGVGEFMEIVERAYATAPECWHEQWPAFMVRRGYPAATCACYSKRGSVTEAVTGRKVA